MTTSQETISVSYLIKKFLLFKKFILIFTSICTIGAVIIVFFIMKPIFTSSASVKTTSKSNGLGSLLSGGVPDISGLGDLTSGGGGKELALYENILLSRKCIEETITRFKLNDEWEFKYMEEAVKNFKDNVLEITKDKVAGTMEIGINDTDPKRAKEMADFLILQLNKINADLNITSAKNNREFLEGRYNSVITDLKKSEDSLKIYQDKYGISPELSVKAASQIALQLETEIKTEEIKLDLLNKILSPDQAEIKSQNEKIISLKKQLSNIENSPDENSNLRIKGAPDIVLNFMRLQRNVEIQNKILSFILPLYEQSKIEEKKDTPIVIVLDTPNFPEKKSKPRRLKIVAITFAIVFFGSLFGCIVFEKAKKSSLFKDAKEK